MRAISSLFIIIFLFSETRSFEINASPLQSLRDISTIYKVPVTQDVALRVTYTAAKSPSKKVIILLPGRASYFEKNRGLILALTGHNYEASFGYSFKNQADVWCIDFRAQGGSDGRLSPGDQRGHIDHFDTYLNDLHSVIKDKIIQNYKKKNVEFYLMGSSLGGHIVLRYLQDFNDRLPFSIKKSLLVVPMIEMNTSPWPFIVAKALAYGGVKMGLAETYAIGHGDMNLDKPDFKKFKGHHNKKTFEETNAIMLEDFSLVTGGPTYGWVAAAFDSQKKLLSTSIVIPKDQTLVFFLSGNDKTVITKTSQKFAQQYGIKIYNYDDAYHNLLKESTDYAGSFWQDLDKELN